MAVDQAAQGRTIAFARASDGRLHCLWHRPRRSISSARSPSTRRRDGCCAPSIGFAALPAPCCCPGTRPRCCSPFRGAALSARATMSNCRSCSRASPGQVGATTRARIRASFRDGAAAGGPPPRRMRQLLRERLTEEPGIRCGGLWLFRKLRLTRAGRAAAGPVAIADFPRARRQPDQDQALFRGARAPPLDKGDDADQISDRGAIRVRLHRADFS